MCHMDYPRSGRSHECIRYNSSCLRHVQDAFAASIGKGATLHKPKFSEALRTGLIFGAIETLTPLVGWGMGMLLPASLFFEWNHWIAFVLLVFLGGRMVIEVSRRQRRRLRNSATPRFLAAGDHRIRYQP